MKLFSVKEKWELDRFGIAGAIFMLAFAIISGFRWHDSGRIFFLLLMFRDAIWVVFFLLRKSSVVQGSTRESVVAYVSTVLPLCYFTPNILIPMWIKLTADIFSILGFLLSTLATIELGRNVGVAPALRGDISRGGVYRWIKHPMYKGYMFAELGWGLIYPINFFIYAASVSCYCLRIRAENRLLKM